MCKNQLWKLKQVKFNPQIDSEPKPERKRKPRTKKETKKSEDSEFESDLDRPLVKKEKLESEKKPRGKSKGALSGASQLRICSKEFVDTGQRFVFILQKFERNPIFFRKKSNILLLSRR